MIKKVPTSEWMMDAAVASAYGIAVYFILLWTSDLSIAAATLAGSACSFPVGAWRGTLRHMRKWRDAYCKLQLYHEVRQNGTSNFFH